MALPKHKQTSFMSTANIVTTPNVVYAVPVGASGFYSEFLIAGNNGYIKTKFAPSKKNYTVIDKAKQNMIALKPQEEYRGRLKITIAELLNPEL